jgi:TPR repeat protein
MCDRQPMKRWLFIIIFVAGCAAAALISFQFLSRPSVDASAAVKLPPVDVASVRSKAESGDAKAEAQLAQLYVKGEGLTNSYVEAAKWFRRAADQGNSDGQLGLGELYEAGQGVPKDLDQAVKLYRQAAEQGNANGQYTLAFMCESGRGVRQDHVEAAKWFRRAAEQGQPLAQYDLGQRYNLGVGVAADRVEALKWLTLAAAHGQTDAADRRDRLKKELSRDQIAEAERRVAEFYHPSHR